MYRLNPQIKPVDSICLSFLGECQGSLRMIRKKMSEMLSFLSRGCSPVCNLYNWAVHVYSITHPLLLFLSLYGCSSDSLHVELPPAPMIWSCSRFFPVSSVFPATLADAWVVIANLDWIGWNINKAEPACNCCVKEHKWCQIHLKPEQVSMKKIWSQTYK